MQLTPTAMKQEKYKNAVYANLTSVLQFENENQRAWWEETASLFGSMMERADYDIHSQYFSLLFFHEVVLSSLGPRPRSDGLAPWKSFMTDDFTPIETSWNFSSNKSLVRLGIEPIGAFAGTPCDPFNESQAMAFIQRMGRFCALTDLDFQLFNHFAQSFRVPNDKAQDALENLPENEHTTQVFFGLDFHNSKVSLKSYVFPILKSLQTGISSLDLVSQTIAQLDTQTISVNAAWNSIEEYLRSSGLESQAKFEVVGVDCVNPRQSRIKVYFRVPYTSFEKVREVFTLGGRLDNETTRTALGILRELWWRLLGLSEHFLETDELVHRDQSPIGQRTAGILFNFELKSGEKLPEPKLYIPVRHYAGSDVDIAQGLASFFEWYKWPTLAESYVTNLKDVFPDHPLAKSTGTHTYIAFAFKKKTGIYLTSYLNPQVYAKRAKGHWRC